MNSVKERLKALGLTLPKAAAPVANYVPFVRSGNLVIISGPDLLRARRQAVRGP